MKQITRITAFAVLLLSATVGAYAASPKGVVKQVNVSEFTGVKVSGVIDLEITQGPAKVEVIAPEAIQPMVKLRVENSCLNVSLQLPKDFKNTNLDGITVRVSNPTFNHIEATGASDVELMTDLSAKGLTINMTGSTDMKFKQIVATDMSVNLSGATDMKGSSIECSSLVLNQSGSSDVVLNVLTSPTVKVMASGASDVDCGTVDCSNINIQLSGSSEFKTRSLTAVEVKSQMSGASDFKPSKLLANTVSVGLSGSSEFKAPAVEAASISIMASGGSEATVGGKVSKVHATASGCSEIDLKKLKYDNIESSTSGSSEIYAK